MRLSFNHIFCVFVIITYFYTGLSIQCVDPKKVVFVNESDRLEGGAGSGVEEFPESAEKNNATPDKKTIEALVESYKKDEPPNGGKGFIEVHELCSDDGTRCKRIENHIVTEDGIILSILDSKSFPSGAREVFFKTMKIDFEGNELFTYRHSFVTNETHFIDLGDRYVEVISTVSHDNSTPFNKIYVRDSKTGKTIPNTSSFDYFRSSIWPAYDANTKHIIVPGTAGKIIALTEDLKMVWEFQASAFNLCSPIVDSNSNIYACLRNGEVISISKDGKLIWSKKIIEGASFGLISLSPNNKPIITTQSHVYQLDRKGNLIWKSKDSFDPAPAVFDSKGNSWLGAFGALVSFSSSGEKLITYYLGGLRFKNSPIILNDNSLITFGANANILVQFSASQKIIKTLSTKGYRIYGQARKNSITINKDYIYLLASPSGAEKPKEGFLKVPNENGFKVGKYWSTHHGNPKNHRQPK